MPKSMKRNGQQKLHDKSLRLQLDMKKLLHLVDFTFLEQSVTSPVESIISFEVVQVAKAIQVNHVSIFHCKMI